MLLSILICSLVERKDSLNRLLRNLNHQIEGRENEVEIIIEIDNRELTIGKKRNILIEKAQGEYIAFVDDDDLVAPNYIELILNAIKQHRPDVLGMTLIMNTDGKSSERCFHSIQFKQWLEVPDQFFNGRLTFMRYPNHLNPTRRELAKQVKFVEINYLEDRDYSRQLLPLLQTEYFIEQPIYFYLFNSEKKS